MTVPPIQPYHRPTVQALGSVRDLTRNGAGSGIDGGGTPGMMMVSDQRLKEDIQPLVG